METFRLLSFVGVQSARRENEEKMSVGKWATQFRMGCWQLQCVCSIFVVVVVVVVLFPRRTDCVDECPSENGRPDEL